MTGLRKTVCRFSSRVGLVLAAGLVLLATADARAAENNLLPGISGPDDRRSSESTAYPWRTIGRVNRRTGGFCTGTLIAKDKVVTAAHCLWNQRTLDWLPPDSLHFVAGYNRGDYLGDSRVTALTVSPDYDPRAPISPRNISEDWAVLTLARGLGERLGWLPFLRTSPAIGEAIVQAGYSQDRAHILTVVDNCRVRQLIPAPKILVHDCDATRGDSGSPILTKRDGVYLLFGIHSAVRDRGGESVGLAVPAGAVIGPAGAE